MNPLQRGHEFIGQFATDAPAFQFHVPWACLISQQGLIDSQLPEFVRHDRDSHTLRLCLFKQVAHERGFPAPRNPDTTSAGTVFPATGTSPAGVLCSSDEGGLSWGVINF